MSELNLAFSQAPPTTAFPADLRRLTLDGCHWLTDEHLEEISRSNSGLEEVSLYWCVKLTDLGVSALLSANLQISRLSLSGIPKLTDETLVSLVASNSGNLLDLDLTRLPGISDAGVLAVSRKFKKLKRLSLYATTQLASDFYNHLEEISSIEDLDLCGHQKLTDSALAAALSRLPNLRRLNLTWCLGLGPLSLEALRGLERLEWLSLFGISGLPREAVLAVIELVGPRLSALDVRGIPAIQEFSQNNCQLLREKLPQLREWKLHS